MTTAPLLVLFDDRVARAWEPLALTRPVGELLFGALTQRARAERALGLECAGYLGCPELDGFEEPAAGSVLAAAPDPAVPRLFLCSRVVPAWGAHLETSTEPAALVVAGKVLGWYAPAGCPAPPPEFLAEPGAATVPPRQLPLEGTVLAAPWELIERNAAQLEADFGALGGPGQEAPVNGPYEVIGSARGWLRTGSDVTLEPGVVLDFSAGPIWLADGVIVRAFTRLAGPAYIGPGTTLLGGSLSSISVGPRCKVHGEIESSIILGYSNKAHDGFLGHSYLGRWVNVGAQTVNSDLKNNYGPVRIWTPAGVVETTSIKLGCLLGDHVKTAIGTLIGTGTVVGAGSSLFGRERPAQFVPPFTWGTGPDATAYDPERFLEAAAAAMSRREQVLSDGMRRLLQGAWERGRAWAES